MNLSLGVEWLVDAHGCDPDSLRSRSGMEAVFRRLVDELRLVPVGEPRFHVFPEPGGVTGLLLLRESHLSCHTFPERGFAAFDLYCCRPLEAWPWEERLTEALGAREVRVRFVERGER